MMIWDTIKRYVAAFFAMIFAGIAAFAWYEKRRADSADATIDHMQTEANAMQEGMEVKQFEAINKERKDAVDSDIRDDKHTYLEPNTTYRL